jgi:hypothetical protein
MRSERTARLRRRALQDQEDEKEPSQEWLGHRRKAPASEGGRYNGRSNPRERRKAAPTQERKRQATRRELLGHKKWEQPKRAGRAPPLQRL